MITGNDPITPVKVTPESEEQKKNYYFDGYDIHYFGLTIRQHFAAMAMQGILANPDFLKTHQDIDIHILAVKNADYLIAELNKNPEK